jgi:Flp pilus assembly protein TadG
VRAQRQTGQNIVEFALGITFLVTMVLGMIDFGRVFYAHAGLTNAAREGAREATRQATLSPPTCDLTTIRSRVQAEQPGLITDPSIINVDCSQADRRTITIQSYPFPLANPFIDPLVGDGTGHVRITTWATLPVI